MSLFYALLLAHLIADFLQPASLVRWTKRSINGLLVHTAVYAFLSAIVLVGWSSNWWLWLIILSFSHFILDYFKYLLSIKLSLEEFYIFVADQILHIGVMILVVFGGNRAQLEPPPFLYLISDYQKLLPSIVGYVAGIFAVSILVFEAGRTFASQSDDAGGNAVITFKDRFPGMIERALAISLILAHLYYLVPFSFIFSIYQVTKRWKTNIRRELVIKLSISMLSAIVIGLAIVFL